MSQGVFANILVQAVEYDKNGKMNEALACYKEGIALLINFMKGVDDQSKLAHYQTKLTEYFKRAEDIKEFLKKKQDVGDHIHFDIKNGDKNFSYKTILAKYMDPLVTSVKINDPYIRSKYHALNLLKFIETLISGCPNLKKIDLLTSSDPKEGEAQMSRLKCIQNNLKEYFNILFTYNLSSTLHDRSIMLSNGWCIKIGRGLDYFQPCNMWCPGFFELDLRPCKETTVDIFYSPESDNESH